MPKKLVKVNRMVLLRDIGMIIVVWAMSTGSPSWGIMLYMFKQ